MSNTKTPKTAKASKASKATPTDHASAITLCEHLSKSSKRWGHMTHGPRVTSTGELILETIESASDARSWVTARAGESGAGKVESAQLAALIKRVAEVDPDHAQSFIEAVKDSGADDAELRVRRWMGDTDSAPGLVCPELICLEGEAWKTREAALHFEAVREFAEFRKMLDRRF